MRKYILLALLVLVVIYSGTSMPTFLNAKPSIVTTTFPLYDFTKQIVGDKVDVVLLVPPGAEPHSWEPGPADMIKIKKATLFIYNGAGLEHWLDKVDKSVLTGKKTLDASTVVTLLPASEAEHEHEETHAADHGHEGEFDPHIWLDPVNAQQIVLAIAAAIGDVDPANRTVFINNAQSYHSQLTSLHQEYTAALAPAAGKEFVTTHAAFAYLAQRYGLRQSAIMGINPEAEPTPEAMAAIIRHIKHEQLTYIFAEPVLNPKLAQTISRETGVQILTLNPVHEIASQDVTQGQTYLSMMRANLVNLAKSFHGTP